MLLASNATTDYPLELSSLVPSTPSSPIVTLHVGDTIPIQVGVLSLSNSSISTMVVLQDINQNGVTDFIQVVNITVPAQNETVVSVPRLIQTAGTHTITVIALSRDSIPSLLAEKASSNAVIET